jgi:hypothetical protein
MDALHLSATVNVFAVGFMARIRRGCSGKTELDEFSVAAIVVSGQQAIRECELARIRQYDKNLEVIHEDEETR